MDYVNRVRNFLQIITVEPIVFLAVVGQVIYATPMVDAMYLRYCQYTDYADGTPIDDDPTARCTDSSTWNGDIENRVQRTGANWDIYTAIASTVPSIFTALFLGAWGDRHGRAINIAIGLGGTTVTSFASNLVISEKYKFGLWILIVGNLVSGLTGTFTLVPINMFAYLSDITKDQKLLAFRITMIYATLNGALIVGNFLTVWLVSQYSDQTVACIGFVIAAIPFFDAIWRIPQIPPVLLKPVEDLTPAGREHRASSTVSKEGRIYRSASSFAKSIGTTKSFFGNVFQHIKDAVMTFFKKRKGHRRCFLLWMAFFYFVILAVFSETKGTIIQFYTYRHHGNRAIRWTKNEFSLWLAVSGALGLIGSVVSISILKKWLDVRDTIIILIGMASRAAKIFIIGMASEGWHMYVSSVVGMIADITRPGIYGFTAHLVARDETGKAYTMFGLAENFAFIVGTTVFDSIYSGSIGFFAGFLFVVITAVLILCEVIMVWIHFVAQKEGIGIEKKKKRRSEVETFELEEKVVY